ncbi:hypothetical protein SLA2020_294610 [Shorea laevis]
MEKQKLKGQGISIALKDAVLIYNGIKSISKCTHELRASKRKSLVQEIHRSLPEKWKGRKCRASLMACISPADLPLAPTFHKGEDHHPESPFKPCRPIKTKGFNSLLGNQMVRLLAWPPENLAWFKV